MAALRDDNAARLHKARTNYGPLLENFVISEVLKLTTWSDRRGRVIGIEIKASATVRPQDLRGLRQLQEAVGDKFIHGLVLHDHDRITPFEEKLHAGPVSLL